MKTIFKYLKDKQVEENEDLSSVLDDLRVHLLAVATRDIFQVNVSHHQRYPKRKWCL